MQKGDAHSNVKEIRAHVIGLFDAFLAGDRDALAAGRTSDWKGFQIQSTRLIHGRAEYTTELERVLGGLKVERYEFLDFEVDVIGDLALVYYVARDWLLPEDPTEAERPRTILIRSLDVYRNIEGSWTQIASNICSIGDTSSVGPADSA
jgi:hypothetical protein